MKAALITEVGSTPHPGEVEEPRAGAGEALVAVRAASLNPVELRVAAGRMGDLTLPYVPGLEGAGEVIRSERFTPGTRVRFENHLPGFGKDGAMRAVVVADEESLVELPQSVSETQAAAVGVVGITAELALRRAGVVDGERVAVLGATGGVGQMAVQLARRHGASTVVAVGRHVPTLEHLRSRGATSIVELDDVAALGERLREAAGGPIDVVIDSLWGEPAMVAIGALGEEGRLINVGNEAGTEVRLPLPAMRQVRSAVIGLSSGWTALADKVVAYRSVLRAVEEGEVTVDHETVPLEAVSEAWRRQSEGPHTKLVVSLA